jgi:hypothetical protein
MVPNDKNAMSKQIIPACASWGGSPMCLSKVQKGALTPRDVKNEGTSGDVYENKGPHDTMPDNKSRFWPENSKIRDNWRESSVF